MIRPCFDTMYYYALTVRSADGVSVAMATHHYETNYICQSHLRRVYGAGG